MDYARDWLWKVPVGEVIPPFSLELVLRDSSHYFLHSIEARHKRSGSVVLKVWDLRALDESDLETLRVTLAAVDDREMMKETKRVHPRLDTGTLRMRVEDLWYCIEWRDPLKREETERC